MSKRKKILLIGLALLLGAALLLSFRAKPVPISVSTVARGALEVTVEQEGKTRVRDRFVVSAPVAGFAPRLDLDVGDPVEKDSSLLLLQPSPASLLDPRTRAETEARVAQAKALLNTEESRLKAARAANELAQREYERNKTLVKRGDVSESVLDRSETDARQAEANLRGARFAVEAARHELRAAEAALAYYAGAKPDGEAMAIKAPVAGRVLAVHHESSGVVAAGEPLLTIGDPASLEIEVDVLSADAVRIRPGMTVWFDRWGGDEPLEGRVRVVEPAGFTKISALGVEEQRVWVISDIVSPREQWQTLGDGYRVEARFILWHADDILQIPSSALFRNGQDWAVFVAENGRARRRKVTTGHEGDFSVEILGGLSPGEQVITHPDDSIVDGVRVQLRAE